MKTFKSILEFQKHFSTDEKCREFLEAQRWGAEPACVFCGSLKVTRKKDGKRFQCNEKECRKQFSVTVGTVIENTKIPLTKWFLAMYILSNHSKGISSLQLASWLDVTQKTAWFLNHRVREMLTDNAPALLEGIVEIDETHIGGKIANRHKSKRDTNRDNKTMVFGAVSRTGKVITKVVPDKKAESLIAAVNENVHEDAIMVSDENPSYNGLKKKYNHHTVNHNQEEYVRGFAHTNQIEGFWNLLKKQINGIHHSVSPKHLDRYCTEAAYRYNNRKTEQDERFANALTNCEGRLKYNDLINKV
jgi:transposase-like protein